MVNEMKLQRGIAIQIHNEAQYLELMRMYEDTFSATEWPWNRYKWQDMFERYQNDYGSVVINIEPEERIPTDDYVNYCEIEYYQQHTPYCYLPIIDFDELDRNLQIINPSDLESLLLT